MESHVSAGLNHEYDNQPKKIDQIVKPALNQAAKQESLRKTEMKLDALEEESEGESKCCSDLGKSYTDESIEDHVMCKVKFIKEVSFWMENIVHISDKIVFFQDWTESAKTTDILVFFPFSIFWYQYIIIHF